jgi:6-pyruvoyltetrahydropterin/6-carboxytetrahydropterin synthase
MYMRQLVVTRKKSCASQFAGIACYLTPVVLSGRTFEIEVLHWLPKVAADHPCAAEHAHPFRVEICCADYPAEKFGAVWLPLYATLDRRLLNEIVKLEDPTPESLARFLFDGLLAQGMPVQTVRVYDTFVYETLAGPVSNAWCEVS